MHINRGLVFWGVALITAGAVALAIQSGVIAGESARELWRFWPVVLIVIGLAVIAARTPLALVATLVAGLVVGGMAGTLVGGFPDGLAIGCGGEPDESVTGSGGFAGPAVIELDINCGELDVSTAEGGEWSVEARYSGDEPTLTSSDTSLRLAVEDGGGFNFADQRQAWEVVLPTDRELSLTLDANAASSDLDLDGAGLSELEIDANAGSVQLLLGGATVESFSLDANAGSVAIVADGSTELSGTVEMNAGSLELCVPESLGLAITIVEDNITFSDNLDERGLTRQGDTWRSGDGTPAISLEVEGNAAGFSLNPDGGCS